MSLRNSLRRSTELQVASPKPCNTQLSVAPTATADETALQPRCTAPGYMTISSATATATPTQLDPNEQCNSVDELHVARTRECNTQLGGLTAHRIFANLVAAIHRCCNARGDDDANRAALIAECAPIPPAQQAGWREHFDTVADRYEAANRGAIKP